MPKSHSHQRSRWIAVVLIVIILGSGLVVALHEHNIHKAQTASGTIPTAKPATKVTTTKDKSQQASNQVSSTTSSSTDTAKSSSSTNSTSAILIAPFGTFVSNHKPGQNGSPTTEQSVCNTTPGATCNIEFTNGSGTTKSLGVETANGSGAAYWSWDVNGSTLAPGSWQITALVNLNGQTKTTTDPTPLEVQ